MSRVRTWFTLIAATSAACARPDVRAADTQRTVPTPIGTVAVTTGPAPGDTVAVCKAPAGPFIVSPKQIGPFRVGVSIKELGRQCPLPRQSDYTLGGIQGPSFSFHFPGARVVAVQFQCSIDESCPDSAPTFWEITGDSVRLPDGTSIPKTVGEMRQRYGMTVLFPTHDDVDDSIGDQAYACRFPHYFFDTSLSDSLSLEPIRLVRPSSFDSHPIGSLTIWTPAIDTADRWCGTAHD
jgi:hypothetical protein